MHLTKIATSKNTCAFAASFKGRGQSVDRTTVRVAAVRPVRSGAHSLKNLRVDSSHHDSSNLKRLEPWASKKAADIEVKGHVCTYTRNVP
jgi:hypothetical protein